MGLQRAFVFRQLDGAARFSRFGVEDIVLPVCVLLVATFASLLFGFHPLYAGALFVAALAASWLLRTMSGDPPMTVVVFMLTPKHYSALALDRFHRPYPGAPHST